MIYSLIGLYFLSVILSYILLRIAVYGLVSDGWTKYDRRIAILVSLLLGPVLAPSAFICCIAYGLVSCIIWGLTPLFEKFKGNEPARW